MTEVKPVPVATGTLVRDVLVVLAALPILVKLIGARDLTALLQWLQSSEGATLLAIILPVIASGWRAWWAYHKERKLLEATPPAAAVPVEP